jgi:flagellar basal body rod protein FlgC
MISLNTSIEGMQQAETNFNKAAAKIANPAQSNSQPADTVDLLQAKHDYEANLKAAEVSNDMTKATLDLLA